jgi:hypothetical protein
MNNNKQMAMMNECEICCEVKWAPECGAINNCNKRVCDDCFLKNRKGAKGYIRKCMFCFEPDYKRALVHHMSEYSENVDMYEENDTPLGRYIGRLEFWEYAECYECEI